MITREQYEAAVKAQDEAEKVIHAWDQQQREEFAVRLQESLNGVRPFTDDELIYSASTLCPCGHGLAYPKGCGGFHYWDCSAILKGTADAKVQHTGKLPFTFYDIKSEGERMGGGTTRGVFRPKPSA